MTKVLVIGMGGVGTIASFVLQSFNKDVEVTSVVRSDYDKVISDGYTIYPMSVDSNIEDSKPISFTPKNVVKLLDEACQFGPFDYIIVSVKVIPKPKNNIWDLVYDLKDKLVKTKDTSIILLQNGINIERNWAIFGDSVTLISGVSYISSVNTKGTIKMYAAERVEFGLFENLQDKTSFNKFVEIYSHPKFNLVEVDNNCRFTRMKKLLYNASFNTVCSLTDSDVGILFTVDGIIDEVIEPVMHEIKKVANQDLKRLSLDKFITDKDIEDMIKFTKEIDAPTNYQPSMLVDARSQRPIELESILGNLIEIYKLNNPGADLKQDIPYLKLIYHTLKVLLYKLS